MEKGPKDISKPFLFKSKGIGCVRGAEEGEKLLGDTGLTERQIMVISEFTKFRKRLRKPAPVEDAYGEVVYVAKPKGGK